MLAAVKKGEHRERLSMLQHFVRFLCGFKAAINKPGQDRPQDRRKPFLEVPGLVISSRFRPLHVPDVRIQGEYLLHCFRKFSELRGGINFPEKLPHYGKCWIGEAQELVVIPVLVPATNSEPESVVLNGYVPSPVLRNDLLRPDSPFG